MGNEGEEASDCCGDVDVGGDAMGNDAVRQRLRNKCEDGRGRRTKARGRWTMPRTPGDRRCYKRPGAPNVDGRRFAEWVWKCAGRRWTLPEGVLTQR